LFPFEQAEQGIKSDLDLMNNKFCFIALLLLGCCNTHQSEPPEYRYSTDLTKLENGGIPVQLRFSGVLPDTAYFCLPKMVPGIYDDTNFGKFVKDFRAHDAKGDLLEVHPLNTNCWQIIGAEDLDRVEYTAVQGWDNFDFEDLRPYRSAESHFGETAFVLNPNSIFGYFENQEDLPFHIAVQKEEGLYGSSSLEKQSISGSHDEFKAENYRYLVDNPMMYAAPDTVSIDLPNISVRIASYSSTGIKIADSLAVSIAPLLKNQSDYLDGNLATNKYTFLVYHNENTDDEAYFSDGLEHNESTVVLMYSPLDMEVLKAIVFQLASHEFFHTVQPLGLHSYEIADFDFSDPEFSQHLWLYEGMTEYFTIHMRIKQKMESLDDFLRVLEQKVSSMNEFSNDMPFTEFSKNVMDMPDAYMNVYFKGPLINLCLDIRLRELSNGAYGVQELIADLLDKYGKDKPFQDDVLFDEIYALSGYPELRTFVEKYIAGTEQLPLKETLEKVGFSYNEETGDITEMESLTDQQKLLRKHWINQ
jgi:predicted metalloprotease with PDZ domain